MAARCAGCLWSVQDWGVKDKYESAKVQRILLGAMLSHMTQLITPQYIDSLGIRCGGQARALSLTGPRAALGL